MSDIFMAVSRGSRPVGLEHGRETRRSQVGVESVFQQLYDLGGPCGAAVLRLSASEDLFRQTCKLQRHPKLSAITICEAQILAGKIHGETDVVAAVQNQLTLSLVYEARAGACFDGGEGLSQVEAGSLCQHQCFSCRD